MKLSRMTSLAVLGYVGLLGAITLAGACSAGGDSKLTGSANGSGASSGSLSGSGGFNATGGNGSGGTDDCVSVSKEALPQYEDADIIFAVDTSGSMTDEIGFVQNNLNQFSTQIINSGIDVHVIMLAEHPFPCPIPPFCPPTGVCVAAPLGNGMCPADDTNLPHYIHPMGTDVGSTDALSVIVNTYPSYSAHIRTASNKYLVIVTDDNASAPNIADAQTFINTFTALDPSKLTGFTAHAIYCFDGNGACVTKGQAYEDLVNLSGGIHGNLALQDFLPIFNAISTQVITNSASLPCEYAIPAPPMGETLDPAEVNVVYTDGTNQPHDIYKVANAAACDPMTGGWYYDNDQTPTKIFLCPASCDTVSLDVNGKIDIAFGCATKQPPVD